MTVDEEILEHVVDQIVELAHPDRVILFGSAATGEMTADSDLDLLVVEPQVANTRREHSASNGPGERAITHRRDRHEPRTIRGDKERDRRHRLPGP